MKKRLLSFQILIFLSIYSFSQGVGIGKTNPDASAILDITATNKGLLIPRLSTASINAITNPARGLLVYDSVANQLIVNTGTPGVPNWQPIIPGIPTSGWALTGNTGINPSSQFIGNTDNQPLRFRINNIQAGELNPANGNVSWGLRAGQGGTTGFSNIAIGVDALKTNTATANLIAIGDSAMFNNTGGLNMAIGSKSLFTNTTGVNNTAVGPLSLFTNVTGSRNTAVGVISLNANTTGAQNTATGYQSLFSNTTGQDNTAIGVEALLSNTTATGNTAVGKFALMGNTTGGLNTAVGTNTLQGNTGFRNTAVGAFALGRNTGTENVGMGFNTMEFNNTGSFNVAIGDQALESTTAGQFNVAVGHNAGLAFDNGLNNTIVGANSDFNQAGLSNSIALGEGVILSASNQARIGNAATSSIGGFANWTNFSDGRYKKNIQEGVKGIDFIMQLRPVTYQLDISGILEKLNKSRGKEINERSKKMVAQKEGAIFSGFVAQEVEQAAKNTGYNFSGVDKPKNENDFYGLRYAEFVVPLVKAIQEQQKMINELKNRVLELEKK